VIKMEAATETVTALFESFREHPGSTIEEVKVAFHAPQPSSKQWIFTVSREWSVEENKYVTAVVKSHAGQDFVHIHHGGRGFT
jgi:hypothetical protein